MLFKQNINRHLTVCECALLNPFWQSLHKAVTKKLPEPIFSLSIADAYFDERKSRSLCGTPEEDCVNW
jgi:hypothetical protein